MGTSPLRCFSGGLPGVVPALCTTTRFFSSLAGAGSCSPVGEIEGPITPLFNLPAFQRLHLAE
eukprot:14995191-Alexandrium_andersonii.AAC.1